MSGWVKVWLVVALSAAACSTTAAAWKRVDHPRQAPAAGTVVAEFKRLALSAKDAARPSAIEVKPSCVVFAYPDGHTKTLFYAEVKRVELFAGGDKGGAVELYDVMDHTMGWFEFKQLDTAQAFYDVLEALLQNGPGPLDDAPAVPQTTI